MLLHLILAWHIKRRHATLISRKRGVLRRLNPLLQTRTGLLSFASNVEPRTLSFNIYNLVLLCPLAHIAMSTRVRIAHLAARLTAITNQNSNPVLLVMTLQTLLKLNPLGFLNLDRRTLPLCGLKATTTLTLPFTLPARLCRRLLRNSFETVPLRH